eukprot:Gb_34348 [translate_table: standard]
MFITNHHMAQAIYRQFASLKLLKVAENRFASHFIVLRQLLEVKSSLCNMVISDVWDRWRLSNTDRAQELKRIVLDDIWWGRVQYLLNFCEPIVSMIRLIDTDTPCLGEVYEGMDSMLEKIREVIRLEEKDEGETFYNEIQDIIVKRWNKMNTPLHTLAYALKPRFYHEDILSIPGRKAPNKGKEVLDGYKKAFRKLYPNAKITCDVRMEFSEFAYSQNSYGDIDALIDKKAMPSVSWWNYHGGSDKHLQTLAIRILS